MEDREDEICKAVLEKVKKELSGGKDALQMERKDLLARIEETALEEDGITVDLLERVMNRVYAKLRSKIGIITDLVEDDRVNEIMVNGPDDIFVEDRNGIRRVDERFGSAEELEEVMRNIAADSHREINEMHPILDARLENGARVNAVYGNISQGKPVLTIRKFAKERITIGQMVEGGTLTKQAADVLALLVRCGYNLIICGGTSSGKTTFLNALTDFIPEKERVIVIEDSRELMLDGLDNVIQMECRTANSQGAGGITMDMLIRTSLRMRPDRIIVGEVRGKEVAMMLQAMNTGHDGSITTGHGNSVEGMLLRLEAMYLMAEEIPLDAVRTQILEGIDIIVHLKRMADGKRKVMEISELVGFENGAYVVNPLFLAMNGGDAVPTGNRLCMRAKLLMSDKA